MLVFFVLARPLTSLQRLCRMQASRVPYIIALLIAWAITVASCSFDTYACRCSETRGCVTALPCPSFGCSHYSTAYSVGYRVSRNTGSGEYALSRSPSTIIVK